METRPDAAAKVRAVLLAQDHRRKSVARPLCLMTWMLRPFSRERVPGYDSSIGIRKFNTFVFRHYP